MGRIKSSILPITIRDRVRMHRERMKIRREASENINSIMQKINILDTSTTTPAYINENQNSNTEVKLRESFSRWASEFRISKRAIDSLLNILNLAGIKSLPKNHRTLQKTPTHIEMTEVAGGKFWYHGLAKSLKTIFCTLDRDISIQLNFNTDGLPLYKSSKICFWPILASIYGILCYFKFLKCKH